MTSILNNNRTTFGAALLMALCGFSARSSNSASAALIQLKPHASVTTTMVRLGDVAVISDVKPDVVSRLQEVLLQPAPLGRRIAKITTGDVRSRLQAVGENLAELEFQGAVVTIVEGSEYSAQNSKVGPTSNFQRTRIQQKLVTALQKYLDNRGLQIKVLQVTVPMNTAAVHTILTSNSTGWQITAGQLPWRQQHEFKIRMREDQTVSVISHLGPKPRLWVLRHPVERGHVISRGDLAWKVVADLPSRRAVINNPNEIIGQEALRPLSAGQPIKPRDIKKTALIKQNDLVTVRSREGGVTVETYARSREEGGRGDLVSLKTLRGGDTIVARVIGFHLAEIDATGQPAVQNGGLTIQFDSPPSGRERTGRSRRRTNGNRRELSRRR